MEGDNTGKDLEKSLTCPQDKTKNNTYQRESLSYVEGFNEGIINNDPTDLFPIKGRTEYHYRLTQGKPKNQINETVKQ